MVSLRWMHPEALREAGGWRRLFVAGTFLLAVAAIAWAWLGPGSRLGAWEKVEQVLVLWSLGAPALGLLILLLALFDRGLVWVGAGFGLAPGRTRVGIIAVLAGLTFLGALGQFLRYETVMPASDLMSTGELCVVLDRWTGETRPCTDEALYRQERKRAEPRRAQESRSEEVAWRQILSIVSELMEVERWLPNMAGRY